MAARQGPLRHERAAEARSAFALAAERSGCARGAGLSARGAPRRPPRQSQGARPGPLLPASKPAVRPASTSAPREAPVEAVRELAEPRGAAERSRTATLEKLEP